MSALLHKPLPHVGQLFVHGQIVRYTMPCTMIEVQIHVAQGFACNRIHRERRRWSFLPHVGEKHTCVAFQHQSEGIALMERGCAEVHGACDVCRAAVIVSA